MGREFIPGRYGSGRTGNIGRRNGNQGRPRPLALDQQPGNRLVGEPGD
jgi:hypothetical protein